MSTKTMLALCAGLLAGLPFVAKSQTIQTEFGKNRVQFHRFAEDWVMYETANIGAYWFGDARPIAQSAMQMAELDFADIQSLLEHPMAEKIELLVFSDLSDLKQSNIGIDNASGAKDNFGRPLRELAYSGGQMAASDLKVRVVGTRAFVHFDGDHQHLRRQIREGMAGAMLNAMFYGENFQEIVQNAVHLDLPVWFTDGLLAYCGEEWSVELDDRLRDVLATGKIKNFDKLAARYPRLAGHAMWRYVATTFGRQTVSNLLYLTRINRSVEVGFLYVLGSSYRKTADAAFSFYKKQCAEDAKNLSPIESADLLKIKNRRNLPISQLKISPDGKRIAYAVSDLGRWRVSVFDLETQRARTVAKGSSRNAHQSTDFNYPLLAWSPNGQELAVLFEKRSKIKLHRIDFVQSKTIKDELPADHQRVYSMAYWAPEALLFSELLKGQCDLAIFKTATRQTERLTNDFWDDLDAVPFVVGDRRGILWASNRTTDTLRAERLDTVLPLGHFDIFFYDLEKRGDELVRATSTPMADEHQPMQLDSARFAFLSDESGVFNRQAGFLEPYLAFYRGYFFKKNGEKTVIECDFDTVQNKVEKTLRAWRTFEDAVSEDLKTVAVRIDTAFKLPAPAQLDSSRFEAVWKLRSFVYNQTNFDRNLLLQSSAPRAGRLAEAVRRMGRYQAFVKKTEPLRAQGARLTKYRKNQFDRIGYVPALPDTARLAENAAPKAIFDSISAKKAPEGWLFQSPFDETIKPARQPQSILAEPLTAPDSLPRPRMQGSARGLAFDSMPAGIVRINPSRIVPYRLKFRADRFTTTVDNSLLFEGLSSFAGAAGNYATPPAGFLVKGRMKDLFEDYEVQGGFRVPLNFNGAEYFVLFDNKKRRLDRRFALYRKTIDAPLDSPPQGHSHGTLPEPHRIRTKTVLGQYEVKWPLSVFARLQATGTIRQDRTIELSTDRLSLIESPLIEQRAALRLAAVFDNSIDIDLNLKTGSRAKIWAEAVKRFNINPERKQYDFSKGFMTVLGVDARHYQRLDRRSVLAVRLAAATTFGSERILYYLGGVEQGLFQKFNSSIPLPTGNDFAYQTLAANLRGFQMNIRNGNSYALLNAELRAPLFKYFNSKPSLGAFWRNFQLVAFFDMGSAWQGRNPYDGDNPINTVYLQNPPTVKVKVNYFRDPLVAGYGAGLRTTVLGTLLRVDYGWGIETRVVQKPVLHIALGTDF